MPKTAKDTADQLLFPQWLLTLDTQAKDQGLEPKENQAVVLSGTKIIDILPQKQALLAYPHLQPQHLQQQLLMPGLHNMHGHAAMSLFRGLADDLPLMTWLEEHIWPAEGRHVSDEFVRSGTRLAIAEMLLSGTSCFSDMYFFPEVAAEVAQEMGMRIQVCAPIIDFPNPWSENPDQALDKIQALHSKHQDSDLVEVAFGPHAPYTVSDPTLKKLVEINQKLGLRLQMHVHETAFEVDKAVEDNGIRPLQRLDKLGLLDSNFMAVHLTQLNAEDIQLLAARGVTAVHCPQSNLKLASGFSPIERMRQAGISVCLGTDGAASNNDLDLWAEMQTAALLAKAVDQNAAAVPAGYTLQMATVMGGQALSSQPYSGQLRKGFAADLCSLKLDTPDCWPSHHLISQLVYGRMADKVHQVWVAGQQKVSEGRLLGVDLQQLEDEAKYWQNRIQASFQSQDTQA
ncbi:Cytosine/adenosine deaminase [Marinospirillum celere]|uniref:Cytosine/adenosine deaminase n=1 Tax=Marinospirillum celere TaxID=1122252 RepID=A0A1I1ENI7_9GAMM|nr:TRZ/ATZ family hydrolase [Marinospirillum celere]SFB86480.1 Cytosine/adenosine deaminase [Marinospirillum celere]